MSNKQMTKLATKQPPKQTNKTNSKSKQGPIKKTLERVATAVLGKKIRYAVVGVGHIAQAAVIPAFKNAKKNSELVALVSGDAKKLKEVAKKHGVKHCFSYEEYDECLQSGLIDAVYIALPNNLHREYTERAARHGIHVLCEKPLAVNEKEARAMIDATSKAGVKLMTAYRLHFHAGNMEAVKIAQSGKLGELRFFSSNFSFRLNDDNIRSQKELGGGPLHDIGVYCINAARYIFRETPYEVFAFKSRGLDKRFSEVDEMASATMRFSDGKLATFTCSFGGAPTARYEVVGTKGRLIADGAYEWQEGMKLQVETVNGKSQSKSFKKSDQFAPELLYFSDCCLKNKNPEPGGLEGLIDVRIVEALNESARTGKPVAIRAIEKKDMPGPQQVIQRRPVKEPDIVHAESPSAD